MKWNTLVHTGPCFPEDYVYKKIPVTVLGQDFILDPKAEEVAFFWAQKLQTEYIKDVVCQKNFWFDFCKLIPEKLKITNFPLDWDFSKMVDYLAYEKEQKKSKEYKDQVKAKKEENQEKHGYAVIDGIKTPLNNYMVEPPGLFIGRGNHPLRFRLKPRITPEDVVLNHSLDVPIPSPCKGQWKDVVERKNAIMTAFWVQPLTNVTKRIIFTNDSHINQGSSINKFNKVNKLAQNIDYVKAEINKTLSSTNWKKMETATAAKIIAELAIRVGNEKDEDSADTVGVTTLRFEHVKIINETCIELDFLGKDSVRYHQKANLDEQTVINLKRILSNKKKGQDIFNITSLDVNKFFKDILDGISAKDFRTAYGSLILANELRKENIQKLSLSQKIKFHTEANLLVAKKLNHQTQVKSNFGEKIDELSDKLNTYKANYQTLKEEIESLKDSDNVKDVKKIKKLKSKLKKLKLVIESHKIKIDIKKKTKNIALGTSKANYSDPRINFSFAKDNGIPIEKIYTKSLLKKFSWAEDIEEDFYKNYPNI